MEIQKPVRRRRYHPEAFKRSVIEACREPGASLARVALANGIHASQLRRWMRERGLELTTPETPPAFIPLSMAPAAAPAAIRIEIHRGDTLLKVEWPLHGAVDCARWLEAWLG